MRRGVGVFLLATGLLAMPASAQPTKPAPAAQSLAGDWKFESGGFDGGCTMYGTITLKPGKAADSYAGVMKVETRCTLDNKQTYEYWRVAETNVATRTGKRVMISGKITAIESATWQGVERKDGARNGYVPDNFDVQITTEGAEMKGTMVDTVRKVTVRIWRDAELIG